MLGMDWVSFFFLVGGQSAFIVIKARFTSRDFFVGGPF